MRRTTILLSTIGGLCLLLILGWWVYQSWTDRQESTSQPQPVMPSTPDKTPPVIKPMTMTFTSPKGVGVTLDNWTPTMHVRSPLTVTGTIPGNWSFEASFPVELLDVSGKTLIKTPAHLTGDWMTTQPVPFTVTLSFTQLSGAGILRLHKDNPSGLPANDDIIDIPVQYDS